MTTAVEIRSKAEIAHKSMEDAARTVEHCKEQYIKIANELSDAELERGVTTAERDIYKQECEDLNGRLKRLHASADQWEAQANKIPWGYIISTAVLSPLILCLAWVLFTIAVHFAK